MKKISLSKGKFTVVDDADFKFLNQWKWFYSSGGYAMRSQYIRIEKGKYTSKMIPMHRIINHTPDGLFTDHINRNKLDNRKANLRTCDKSLNSINRGAQSNNKCGVRGIYFEKWSKKWRAELVVNGKRFTFGRFINKEDAIKSRLLAEKKYHYATI